jgi:hypothetical protein
LQDAQTTGDEREANGREPDHGDHGTSCAAAPGVRRKNVTGRSLPAKDGPLARILPGALRRPDLGELWAARYVEPFSLLLAEIAYNGPAGRS